jgi:dienelactone hydrolase
MSKTRRALTLVVSACLFVGAVAGAQRLDMPPAAPIDRVVPIRASNLSPGRLHTLQTAVIDTAGRRWIARATYRADARGVIDIERDVPLATSFGDLGAGGLFSGMRAEGDDDQRLRFLTREASSITTSVVLSDSAGTRIDSVSVERRFVGPGVRELTVVEEGLRGHFYLPSNSPAPGVLVLGGSEGGYADQVAALLASNGFAALSLAYFGVEGLPAQLGEIPLEYFERALTWLQNQSAVARGGVGVFGTSKGAEAALLVASRSPAVKAVVAYAPSSVAWGCICADGSRASWTANGKAVVSVPQVPPVPVSPGAPVRPVINYLNRLERAPRDATIPVEQIRGPILLVAGSDDQLWPSLLMAQRLMVRRATLGGHAGDRLLTYDGAGHLIGKGFLPAGSTRIAGGRIETGGTPAANARAQADSWPRAVDFLKVELTKKEVRNEGRGSEEFD